MAAAETHWGDGSSLRSFAPTMVSNERFRAWWARFERLGTSPAGAIALARMNSQIDIRDLLSAVRVPTLVIHRTQDARVNPEAGRYLARNIRGARHVELPGIDHPIWVGDTDRVIDEIQEFLTGARKAPEPDRVLVTVACAELAHEARAGGSVLAGVRRLRELADGIVPQFRGRVMEPPRAEGVMAVFDGPARALRCTLALRDAAADHALALRTGVHMGEAEIADGEAAGVPIRLAARIAAAAHPGEILVTRTVRDVVVGANLRFHDAGERLPNEPGIPRLLLLGDMPDEAPGAQLAALSGREREVLAELCGGPTNAQIAAGLRISEHTVKRHVASILDKLALPNRAAAASFATQHLDSLRR